MKILEGGIEITWYSFKKGAIVLIAFFALFPFTIRGQNQKGNQLLKDNETISRSSIDTMARKFYVAFYPLTKDSIGIYPNCIHVEGKITALTPGTSCGVLCGCGTIKILLSKHITGYNDSFVFIAIPCFNYSHSDFINKRISMDLKILGIGNKDCFWNEAVENTIDSKGIPFYIPENLNEQLQVFDQ